MNTNEASFPPRSEKHRKRKGLGLFITLAALFLVVAGIILFNPFGFRELESFKVFTGGLFQN